MVLKHIDVVICSDFEAVISVILWFHLTIYVAIYTAMKTETSAHTRVLLRQKANMLTLLDKHSGV